MSVTPRESPNVLSRLCKYRLLVKTAKYVAHPLSAGNANSRTTGKSQKAAKKAAAGATQALSRRDGEVMRGAFVNDY
jgi:hypothetical protein